MKRRHRTPEQSISAATIHAVASDPMTAPCHFHDPSTQCNSFLPPECALVCRPFVLPEVNATNSTSSFHASITPSMHRSLRPSTHQLLTTAHRLTNTSTRTHAHKQTHAQHSDRQSPSRRCIRCESIVRRRRLRCGEEGLEIESERRRIFGGVTVYGITCNGR